MTPDFRDLVGVPFLDGGRDPAVGLDCWGLVLAAQKRFGRTLPDYQISAFASSQIAATAAVEVLSGRWEQLPAPELGCLVAMSTNPNLPGAFQHVGVYVGSGRFIHAMNRKSGQGSRMDRIDHPLWQGAIKGYYRWIG